MRRVYALMLVASMLGCGPGEPTDEGSDEVGDESTDDADDADDTDGTDGAELNCADAFPDCDQVPGCTSVSGAEVTMEGDAYYCSDLGLPFGCAPEGCTTQDILVVCDDDDPAIARWVIQGCVPLGWSSCLPGVCG